jgi:hypothetical protein
MTKTPWQATCDHKYLGAWDLPEKKDLKATIEKVQQEDITNPASGETRKATVCYFKEDLKPMILNKTNKESIAKATGEDFIEDWAGHQIQLFYATVSAFGGMKPALRIRDREPK